MMKKNLFQKSSREQQLKERARMLLEKAKQDTLQKSDSTERVDQPPGDSPTSSPEVNLINM